MKDFDIEKLERKNIYKVQDDLFENIQNKVMYQVQDFDIEKLERKNIYRISETLFEDTQKKVLSEIKSYEKVPVFKLNWGYAAAATLALVFGGTFIYNSVSSSFQSHTIETFAESKPQKESKAAYGSLKQDLTSIEKDSQNIQMKALNVVAVNKPQKPTAKQENTKTETATQKINENQMNEYLDAFTSSEIADIASNSNQDVYLDVYN